MSRRILFILFSILLFLPFMPIVFAQNYTYSVSGYVFDDLNANGRYDVGEPGIPGMMVYADNTYSHRAYSDAYGYWRMEVPTGQHSIEISGAGGGGSKPTTSEKFTVTSSNTSIQFGIQKDGYAVEGYVKDQYGRPVVGATVYSDLPNRQNTTTNAAGYYRIDNVGYDNSTPIYGLQGGHGIYVEGYNTNSVLVNPQHSTISVPANFAVINDQIGPGCGATYARDPYNPSNCAYFQNRCSLPSGWVEVGSCSQYPTGGSCSEGQVISTTQRCNGQNLCTYETVRTNRYGSCTTYERESNCNPSSQCVNTSPIGPGPGQCTPGTQAGQPYYGCNGQQYCLISPRYSSSSCSVYNHYSNCQYASGQCGYRVFGNENAYLQDQPTYSTYLQDDSNYYQQMPSYDSPETYSVFDSNQYQNDWSVYNTSSGDYQTDYYPTDGAYYAY